ncbi:MAG: hypothetical protein IT175_06610 [Acidobacteria bacterium]|nr:hypothetical protein [Acidobacteriota bacterium]
MRAVAALVATLALAVTVTAQSRTRTVATSGDAAPGGGTFTPTIDRIVEKGLPSIVDGTIVFGSDVLLNGQTVYAVFIERNRALQTVTRVGAPAPGGDTVQDIAHFAADRFGNVFATIRTGAGTSPDRVLGYTFGVLDDIARVGDTIPGNFAITSFGPSVAADALGGCYVQVGYSATAGSSDTALLHIRSDGTFEIVASTGMAAPGGGSFGGISPATFASNTSGLVVFAATLIGAPVPGALFAGRAGNLLRIDAGSDAFPNISIADNDDAEVAFMNPSTPGIRMSSLTGIATFVQNGMTAPRSVGTVNFGPFTVGLSSDDEGSIFFFAPIQGDPDRGAGLLAKDRFTGAVSSIALQGDPAPGDVSGVFGLFALAANRPARIANDDGRVVFAATAGSPSDKTGIFTTLNAPDGLVPTVASAQFKGSKLVVNGANFEPGAKILVNGNVLNDTKNNKKFPTAKLQAKSGSSAIAPGQTVAITVRNPTGSVSAALSYRRPN